MAFMFKGKSSDTTQSNQQAQQAGFQNRVSQFLTKRRSMRGRAAAVLTAGGQAVPTAQRQVTGN